MFKFFKNLFFRAKEHKDEIETIIDVANGHIQIIANRELTKEEIAEIAISKFREIYDSFHEDDDDGYQGTGVL